MHTVAVQNHVHAMDIAVDMGCVRGVAVLSPVLAIITPNAIKTMINPRAYQIRGDEMRKCWCVLAGTSACDTCPNSREITTTGRYGDVVLTLRNYERGPRGRGINRTYTNKILRNTEEI